MKTQRHTLRALALLLGYPDAKARALMPQLADAMDAEAALSPARRKELRALARALVSVDPIEAETQFVDLFDRGRSTSLHLFEHVHGDSRERGPAMIDLIQTYEQSGLLLGPRSRESPCTCSNRCSEVLRPRSNRSTNWVSASMGSIETSARASARSSLRRAGDSAASASIASASCGMSARAFASG